MEPLSVAASVISVIQISSKVISICYRYQSGVKHASKDLIRTTEELQDLQKILRQLQKFAEEADSQDEAQLKTLELLIGAEGPLVKCRDELKDLEAKLEPKAGLKAIRQALLWPLKEKDVQKILDRIARFKDLLTLALSADQTALTLAIQNDVGIVVKSLASIQLDDERKRIHDWLAPPDPSSNHNRACEERRPTTGAWFIGGDQYSGWKKTAGSFLWLHGIPGCGKTVLSSNIIEDVTRLHQSNSISLVAYFYFDFKDPAKQSSDDLLRSVITQLSAQCRQPSPILNTLYSNHSNGKQQPSTSSLTTCFQSILEETQDCFIVIDALDECKDLEKLLKLVELITKCNNDNLHLLTTSREEKIIDEYLSPLVSTQICIHDELNKVDIQIYVREMISTDRKLKNWSLQIRKEIEDTLMEKAHGMFRWVFCQIEALRKCLKLQRLRQTLDSLPTTLQDTYSRILCGIDPEYQKDAIKILQWLAFSFRPLEITEVADVVGVDARANPRVDVGRKLSEPSDILTICSSLVTTQKAYSSKEEKDIEQIILSHLSVKEYLVSTLIKEGSASTFSIREIDANRSIAETCLAYLLQFNEPDSLHDQNLKEFALAMYAGEFWFKHAQAATDCSEKVLLNSLIKELYLDCKSAYVNYIRISDCNSQYGRLGLIEYDPDVVPPPLYHASELGVLHAVNLLALKDEDINVPLTVPEYFHSDIPAIEHRSVLQAASYKGHEAVVKLLVQRGADVNIGGGRRGTALQAASQSGSVEVVRLLIEHGAEVNAQGARYGTALQAAASSYSGSIDVVRLLIEHGAEVNAQGGEDGTALQAASRWEKVKVVQLLIEHGAEVNAKGGRYGTALQAASGEGNIDVVRLLIKHGAEVNAPVGGEYGTALQAASQSGRVEVVRLLIKHGAEVNAPASGKYSTALQAASQSASVEVVQLLIEHGAEVTDKSIETAVSKGFQHIAKLLRSAQQTSRTANITSPELLEETQQPDIESTQDTNTPSNQIHAVSEI